MRTRVRPDGSGVADNVAVSGLGFRSERGPILIALMVTSAEAAANEG